MERHSYDSIILPDLKICQPVDGFRFGIDSVVLAWFATVKKKDRVVDIGAGSGVLSALISRIRKPASVTAVEVQESMFECLSNTVDINKLAVDIRRADIREHRPQEKYTLAICNPPYRARGTGKLAAEDSRQARFDDSLNMDDLLKFCRSYLQFRSRLVFCGDADRLAHGMTKCKEYGFEPKRLCFMHPNSESPARIFFLEALYGGGSELIVEAPVIQKGKNSIIHDKILQGIWD
jgi:tRNA1Val (adenine37-N6)-methyltransferase